MTKGNAIQFPFTQQHVADTLGMSLVHTNKTLQAAHGDQDDALEGAAVRNPRPRGAGKSPATSAAPRARRPFI